MSIYGMFLLYISVGVAITGAMFYWAVMRGQFKESKRARYLALHGITLLPRTEIPKVRLPKEIFLTLFLAFLGLATLGTLTLVISVTK
jgi:nitrogen fixation-related uncharacterized protein